MAITLQQIADLAGVSRGTVDRALNNRGRIKPEVEQRIKKIAKDVGYKPSRAGRALAMAKKNIKIGVILQLAQTPFMKDVLIGLKAAKLEAESFGASVKIHKINGVNPTEVIQIMEKMKSEKFNGIALSPSQDNLLIKLIDKFSQEYNIPIITFNSDLENTARLCFIGQNAVKSGQTAAGLMGEITNGQGQIIIISGHEENPSLQQRADGFNREISISYPQINNLGIRYAYDDDWVAEKITDEILNKYPNLIVIKSISKSYGVPGLRLGVLASGNYEYLDIINRNMPVWNINSFAEYFLQIFLIYKKDYVYGCSKIKEERNRFYNELIKISELDVYDSEANYFMIKLNKSTANEIAEYLLDNNKILIKVLNGKNGFDDKEYIRIAVKTKEENDYFIQSIKEYYNKK